MRRRRFFRAVLLLCGLVGLLYVLISLFLPSPRRLIFGVDKTTGEIRLAEQNITFLPPHRFYRLSFEKRGGDAQRDGAIRINSQEGIPVTITYRIRFGIASSRLADTKRLVRDGWSAWIRARVSEAVQAVTAQIPVEDLLSPTSAFSARRQSLRDTVARHLNASGLQVSAFEIQRIDIDHEAFLRYKRAQLRRNTRSVFGTVAIFAIEGADWELLTELMIDDRIPNLQAMVKGGVTANVQGLQPTIGPMLWTTVATGLSPDRHGVIEYFDRTLRAPVTSGSRNAPALWEIAPAFGRSAAVVNWWTAWPPRSEEIFVFDAPVVNLDDAVQPASFASRVNNIAVPRPTIGFQQMRRFLNITPAEFQRAVSVAPPDDPIVVFRDLLSKTWTDHRVAIDYYQTARPQLLMLHFEGTDAVNHLFAPYHPPLRQGVDPREYRKFWPVVANYYAEIDRLMGEWIRVLPQDTTVMIISAHGFHWGGERPKAPPKGMSALDAHRNPGALILFGNRVAPSARRATLSLYEIAPTVLSLLGLPLSQEMQGKPAVALLRDLEPVGGVPIVSYADLIQDRPVISQARVDPREYRADLQLIGHLTDPARSTAPQVAGDQRPQASPLSPEQWGTYAYYNNLGVQLKQEKKLSEAASAFALAIELNPARPVPYLNLMNVLLERQQFSAAEDVFREAVRRGLPNVEQRYLDLAAYYLNHDMPGRAINLLMEARELFPNSHLIAVNLGSALADARRYSEALVELERALALQPSSPLALNNLGLIYVRKQDYGRALDYLNRSLSIEPGQPRIRELATALSTHL